MLLQKKMWYGSWYFYDLISKLFPELFYFIIYYGMGSKRADVSFHDKRIPPSMDTRKTRSVTSVLPAFRGEESDEDWVSEDTGGSHSLSKTKLKRCFTPVSYKAMSLRSSWPMHTEA